MWLVSMGLRGVVIECLPLNTCCNSTFVCLPFEAHPTTIGGMSFEARCIKMCTEPCGFDASGNFCCVILRISFFPPSSFTLINCYQIKIDSFLQGATMSLWRLLAFLYKIAKTERFRYFVPKDWAFPGR